MSILVLGTVALDTVKTPFGTRTELLGGSAAHFSMSARLFGPVSLVAVIGQDFPQKNLVFLESKGVDISSVNRVSGKTFKWSGEYTGDMNAAITHNTELGVLLDFKPQITLQQKKFNTVFLANIDPDIQRDLIKEMRSPKLVALDSMNFWINNKRKSLIRTLKMVNIYVANDQEARQLSGENNLIKAARALSKLGPEMVLIKKGEHGVLFYNSKMMLAIPAYPIDKVVDPTGAGDTFAGGFMGYLSRSAKVNAGIIKKAIAYGTICASFNVEAFGLEKTSKLKLADVEKRLKHFRDIVIF